MTQSQIHRHTVGDLLRRTAARLPQKPAIICGETRWTYREFDLLCNRLANGLQQQGVQTGDRVAVLSRNSHAFAALRYALARLGAVIVPINFMLNAQEANYILKHSGASWLAAGPDMIDLASAAASESAVGQFVLMPGANGGNEVTPKDWLTFASLISDDPAEPTAEINGGSLLQIIYTSGTESLPKGALLTHDAVIWQYTSCVIEAGIAQTDLMVHALPLYHCAQLDAFLGPAVYVGATNVITDQPTGENILALIEAHKANSFFAPPSIWIAMMRSPAFDPQKLAGLNKGYYGASIMPVEVLRELGGHLPQLQLWNLYGQTEIAPVATVLQPHEQISHAGSAGRPALNVETRVVNDQMQEVKPGEIGEIVHRSPQLLQGYYNDPERTAAAFVGGWFHSGDLATRDADGYITVVDRKKDMIKTGGENVASRDVEEAIYTLDGISEVAVIGLPHDYWIEAVTAVVVVKPDSTLTEQAVIEHCRNALAHFKVPKQVVIVESLPKNPSGKILKRELRETLTSNAEAGNTP
ncbi:MAG: acyl-CoA synthetase [Burkholderiaceae bacterium]